MADRLAVQEPLFTYVALVMGMRAALPDLRSRQPPDLASWQGLAVAVHALSRSTVQHPSLHDWSGPVTFSAGGSLAALVSLFGSRVRLGIWDLRTQRMQKWLDGLTESSQSICLSASGDVVAAAQEDRLLIWNRQGQLRTVLSMGLHDDTVHCASSGDRIAVWTKHNDVQIYDPRTGVLIREWLLGPSVARQLALSANGRRLLTGHKDGSVQLWDMETGQRVLRQTVSPAEIDAVAMSSDGTALAFASHELLWMWDVAANRPKHLHRLSVPIDSLRFSWDSKYLLVVSDSAIVVMVLNADTGAEVRSIVPKTGDECSSRSSHALSAALSDDGKTLWTAMNEVRQWEIRTDRSASLGADVFEAFFSPVDEPVDNRMSEPRRMMNMPIEIAPRPSVVESRKPSLPLPNPVRLYSLACTLLREVASKSVDGNMTVSWVSKDELYEALSACPK
jgi:WD40 repeat protein